MNGGDPYYLIDKTVKIIHPPALIESNLDAKAKREQKSQAIPEDGVSVVRVPSAKALPALMSPFKLRPFVTIDVIN